MSALGVRRCVALASRACGWAALVAVAVVVLAAVVVPKAIGWVPLTVLSGSMEPAYPVGSQVVVSRVTGNDEVARLAMGDVITFLPRPGDPTVVTHRIVSKSMRADGVVLFRTRGDANNADDPWELSARQIRGQVRYHVPYVGYAATLLPQGDKNVGLMVLTGGLLGYACWQFVGAVSASRLSRGGTPVGSHRRESGRHRPASPRRRRTDP